MKIAAIEQKWNEFRQKIINQRDKHGQDKLTRVDRARERSISILQQRYGFTREEATSELGRHYSKAQLG